MQNYILMQGAIARSKAEVSEADALRKLVNTEHSEVKRAGRVGLQGALAAQLEKVKAGVALDAGQQLVPFGSGPSESSQIQTLRASLAAAQKELQAVQAATATAATGWAAKAATAGTGGAHLPNPLEATHFVD